MYDASLPVSDGSVERPGISFADQTISTIGDGGEPIRIISTAVNTPIDSDSETLTDVENAITDSLAEETTEESDSTLLDDASAPEQESLDNIMESCVPKNRSDKDCIRQNAIKRYLGKLLIGGSLPE